MFLLLFLLFADLDGQGRAMLDPLRARILRPEELIARLQIPSRAVVADVGAGPGFLTVHLARAVPQGRVIATDIRRDYLDAIPPRANVSTRLVAPDDPGLEPRSVDVALLCQVDQYLPDRAGYFGKLAKALRKDGRIVLINYEQHRAANLAAGRQAGLRVTNEWQPAHGFSLVVLSP